MRHLFNMLCAQSMLLWVTMCLFGITGQFRPWVYTTTHWNEQQTTLVVRVDAIGWDKWGIIHDSEHLHYTCRPPRSNLDAVRQRVLNSYGPKGASWADRRPQDVSPFADDAAVGGSEGW